MGSGGSIAPDAIERRKYLARILAIIAVLLVIAETVWMLPLLDQRVSLIIAGKTAPPANLHSLYIVMEFVKLFALVVIAFGAARELVRLPANSSS